MIIRKFHSLIIGWSYFKFSTYINMVTPHNNSIKKWLHFMKWGSFKNRDGRHTACPMSANSGEFKV